MTPIIWLLFKSVQYSERSAPSNYIKSSELSRSPTFSFISASLNRPNQSNYPCTPNELHAKKRRWTVFSVDGRGGHCVLLDNSIREWKRHNGCRSEHA